MRVVVTGAAGLVGAETVARLLRAGHDVTGLMHSNATVVGNDGRPVTAPAGRLRLVTGDVTRPRFGLPAAAWADLATADRIVHCAAITDFGRPEQVYQRINVDGTQHVLDLAGEHGRPLVHVSTAYVCGERSGTVAESDLDVGQQLGNAYEVSKLRAETSVRKARAGGLPVTVVRPSIVVGAARTGVVRDFKNIYIVLKLTTQGRVRSVPGHFDAMLDLVPVDHVAGVVAAATERFDEVEGRTLHATGGALSLREFSDVLAEFPSFHVPRFVAPAAFDPHRLDVIERAYHVKVIRLYESYFRRRITFDRTTSDGFLPGARPQGGRPLLRKLLEYALQAGYLGTPLAGVGQVLSALGQQGTR
jgi:thioester reductase-like protein